jgi:hypothetical protein
MRLYCKMEAGAIASHPIVEANLEAVINNWNPDTPEDFGFKEIIDIPPKLESLQTCERVGFSLKEDGKVSFDYLLVDVAPTDIMNELIKKRREFMLASCDWTQVNDSPLSPEKKAEWADYRQKLRDMPSNYPDLNFDTEIIWPVEPV